MNAQIKTMVALMRRELWEHRGFWTVPAVMASLLTVLLFRVGGELLFVVPSAKIARMNAKVAESGALEAIASQIHVASTAFVGIGLAIGTIMVFVTTFYLLDSLYGDRRDRSILFWRSMPLTDAQTVVSKVATAMVAGPAVTLGVLAAAFVTWGAIAAGIGLAAGIDYWYIGLNPLAWLDAVVIIGGIALMAGLIIAPFAGWLVLASAWAPRAPFLWATLPIVGIALLETMVFDTEHVINAVIGHPQALFPKLFGEHFEGFGIRGDVHESIRIVGGVDLSPAVLAEPRLWIGVVIGAGLVALAIRVRALRDDATY